MEAARPWPGLHTEPRSILDRELTMTTEPNPADPGNPGLARRSRRQAYAFPEGVMYATVWPAKRDRGDVVARVEVTSRPGTAVGGEPLTFLTVRGRAYTVAELYRRVTARLGPHRVVQRWQAETSGYWGGYLNRGGGRVNHQTVTWIRLREFAKATLDRFAVDVPAWADESVQLLLLREWASAQETVTRLDALLRDARAEERELYVALHHATDDATGTEATS